MEAVRDKWTDERLDDMNGHMREGFKRLDEDIRGVRCEIAGVRGEVNGVREEVSGVRREVNGVRREVNELRGEMNTRFEAVQRLIVQVGGGLFGTMLIGFLGLLMTQH